VLKDKGVTTKSTGKALGGLLANLKSGRGLFGEEATMVLTCMCGWVGGWVGVGVGVGVDVGVGVGVGV
jgi:hypothetical protein